MDDGSERDKKRGWQEGMVVEIKAENTALSKHTNVWCYYSCVKSPTLAGLSDDSGRTLTSSDFNLRSLAPDQRVERLLAFSNHEELDRFNQEARLEKRHPEMFALYPPPDEDDAVEIRPIPDCPKEHSGDRILIRCQAIKYVIHVNNTVGRRTILSFHQLLSVLCIRWT
ncbi:hypothetical protein GOODEAATRI_008999 [Goodea atripinnis]|uniref:Uncharacterized protein n=1 Tax=Goodea atripinnis TaxID=208336 RepID=A0ABV0N946_9TELE